MFIDIPYVADILTISRSRQALIDSRVLKENAKQISHDYHIGESVMSNRKMSKSKGRTLQSSLLTLWMEKTQVNNQTKLLANGNLLITL